MGTRISVIVCTYNRCESLNDTLRELLAMEVPREVMWDIIVVDNNSSDNTRAVVESFIATSPVSVRYLHEPRQGLSHARNTGIEATDATYIAFTDDDVLVDRQWLGRIVGTFETSGADCVGGKILPYWLGERPSWLNDSLLNVLAMLDHGDSKFEFDVPNDKRMLFGANFAFKRASLLRVGMFNVHLGRRGNAGIGEDQEMFEKLASTGGRAVYDPGIVVLHKVFPDRMEKRYFRQWYYSAGRDRAKITRESRFSVAGIESHLFVDFARAIGKMLGAFIRGDKDGMFAGELKCILYASVFRHKLLGGTGS